MLRVAADAAEFVDGEEDSPGIVGSAQDCREARRGCTHERKADARATGQEETTRVAWHVLGRRQGCCWTPGSCVATEEDLGVGVYARAGAGRVRQRGRRLGLEEEQALVLSSLGMLAMVCRRE